MARAAKRVAKRTPAAKRASEVSRRPVLQVLKDLAKSSLLDVNPRELSPTALFIIVSGAKKDGSGRHMIGFFRTRDNRVIEVPDWPESQRLDLGEFASGSPFGAVLPSPVVSEDHIHKNLSQLWSLSGLRGRPRLRIHLLVASAFPSFEAIGLDARAPMWVSVLSSNTNAVMAIHEAKSGKLLMLAQLAVATLFAQPILFAAIGGIGIKFILLAAAIFLLWLLEPTGLSKVIAICGIILLLILILIEAAGRAGGGALAGQKIQRLKALQAKVEALKKAAEDAKAAGETEPTDQQKQDLDRSIGEVEQEIEDSKTIGDIDQKDFDKMKGDVDGVKKAAEK